MKTNGESRYSRCPVHRLLMDGDRLSESPAAPPFKKALNQLIDLLEKIASGRGVSSHLQTVASLATYLKKSADPPCALFGSTVSGVIDSNRENFEAHIKDRICLTGDCEVLSPPPCQHACPAGIDVASYVTLIGQGEDREAIKLIREVNPFPWVCGLVCTHPCESVCVRGNVDAPVAIRALKAFVSKAVLGENNLQLPQKSVDNGYKVCVVGAGPSGLTAAYYLALKGYCVTVVESLPAAGGMMRFGIPRFRLPLSVLQREIALIQDLGVEFRFNTRIGKDISVNDLKKEGFESFYIAVGAHKGLQMGVRGDVEFPQVINAVEYLRRVALEDQPGFGPRVAVIGGGNVAVDAARTAVRFGCRDVFILYRRTREEMPALPDDVTQAEQEGIRLFFLKIPVEVKGHRNRVSGIRCLDARLGKPGADGRRRPLPVEGSDHLFAADAVIYAVGQSTDPRGLSAFKKMAWSDHHTIVTDPAIGQTGEAGVFAGGDAVTGPATVIEAIAAGKIAAENIDRYFRGLPPKQAAYLSSRRLKTGFLETTSYNKIHLSRPPLDLLDMCKRKKSFEQVEGELTREEARTEALRCLRCDVCIRCGKCVSACREKLGFAALCLGYFDNDNPTPTDLKLTAEKCILCGSCANICPTGAMTMIQQNDQCVLSMCGVTLCRDTLAYCECCGKILGAARYISYLQSRVKKYQVDAKTVHLCEQCKQRAVRK